MNQIATIYLIDDDPAVVRLVAKILGGQNYRVADFLTGEDFLAHENLAEFGCVITDLRLPGIQGTEIQSQLLQRGSNLSLIVISGMADVPTTVQMMKSGAVTILQKPFTPQQLLTAVEEGLARSRNNLHRHRHVQHVQDRLAELTADEEYVLNCLVKGLSHKAIASELTLSPRTVDRRRHSVLQKMQVATVSELIALVAATIPEKNASLS